MPKICYVKRNFKPENLELIQKINEVIEEYELQGYALTLRQCYYQLVARGIIPNNERSYKNTGSLINDARLAGLVDWYSIEDRTRNLSRLPHWSSPKSIIESASYQYRRDIWENQDYYVEVWVEKEALANVVGRVADELDVPYFCCRGYVSQSEMWSASQRFMDKQSEGKDVVLIHLGDHDPSGIDMSRDIEERLVMFGVDSFMFYFNRIALNMEQIEEFAPPPNPAKLTDSRCSSYIKRFGYESWELDALEPKVIHDLITTNVTQYWDMDEVNRVRNLMENEKKVMESVANDWDKIYNEYR